MSVARIVGAWSHGITGHTPPTEFQLWSPGKNPTDYGVHVWNERSIKEVLARYNERGNPLLIDVEHVGAQKKDGEPAKTGGYARLELRNGAPWLVFDWSDFGREQITTGQRRFLSPEYDVDKNTGEILALYRVSLVADPGTHRARMLATAKREADMPEMSVIMAAIRAALAAEDPAVAKESLTNLLAELEKSAGGEPSESEPTMATESEEPEEPAPVVAESSEENDEEKDKMAARAKPPAKKPGPAKDRVSAAADDAVRVIQNATRDHLLETQGSKLDPSIRRWASAQPLEVVRGLLDATPAKDSIKTRAPATRGGGSGAIVLSDREREMCSRLKIDPAKYAANRAAGGVRAASGE